MNPALRARIERSVSNRARARHNAKETGLRRAFTGPSPRRVSAGRIIPVVAIGIVVLLIVLVRQNDARALEEARVEVLTELAAQRGSLPPQSESFLERTQRLVAGESSVAYSGDVVAPELLLPGELDGDSVKPWSSRESWSSTPQELWTTSWSSSSPFSFKQRRRRPPRCDFVSVTRAGSPT